MADEKVNEMMEQIEKGIKEAMNSERYKAFLRVQSQFHNYSFNNQLLIYMQRPDASNVAGFQTWKNKFERNVMKGEKGIGILAPNPYKYDKAVQVKNETSGEIESQTKTFQGMSFRKVTVFDVKQTDGKPLPQICTELQGNSVNAANIIRAIKQISDVPIIEEVIESGAKGYYSRLENKIVINEGMSLDQTAKTLIHEHAHSQLHNTEAAAMLDRATKEVQAESVAYIVSDHFGVDTSEYSFDYLANWSSGKELAELKSSFDLIHKTASKTIQGIEDVLSKELVLQNSHAKIKILWSETDQIKAGQIYDVSEASKLFTKLDQEQADLRKANPDIDYSKVAAGEQIAHVPYLKLKFELQLSDGRNSETHFDFGESGYKDLYDCIQRECGIDVKNYVKQQDLKQLEQQPQKTVDIIKAQYKNEFTAIKHITENTAHIINNLNYLHGSPLSINEIKDMYKTTGKRYEASNDNSDFQEFKVLKDVVDDFKHAQITEKQEQAHNKAIDNQLSKAHEIEMVQ